MKTAIITGCNRGLGKAFMEAYASNGYDIIAIVRTASQEFEVAIQNLQKKSGIAITPVYAELSEKESLQKALNKIVALERPIDVLINNAGYYSIGVAEAITEEEIRRQIETTSWD